MNQTHPDLAALLRGELLSTEAVAVAAHARECVSCRDDLVDLSLGHGLLSAAGRVSGPTQEEPEAGPVPPVPPVPLRREARGPLRNRAAWAAVAAAVVAVVGVGASAVITARPDARGPTVATSQTATLEPVQVPDGHPTATGRVWMATDRQLVTRMLVRTADLPRAPRGEFYYVWLLDPATDKMLPLGQVTPGREASFDIPESLVAAYSAIDISLESDDGDPGHSVTSVLRAPYAAPLAGSSASPTASSATPSDSS